MVTQPFIRVVLVGFMGAGKTTVGRILATHLGCTFVDLDDVIREREGREIAEIFRHSGEAYFRDVEAGCLRNTLQAIGESAVVALGGGAFAQPRNAALLREQGCRIVFLDASIEELRRRCAEPGAERPLFRDQNQFRQLYELRRGSYMAADLRVETGGKTPEQVAQEILRTLGLSAWAGDSE